MYDRPFIAFMISGLIFVTGCDNTGGGGTTDVADYPAKTVTLVCPWAAGGGTDRVSRFWAEALQSEFGKPFVVVNKTGGSGAVGHSAGAFARPDGHTLTTITAELSTMHRMGITDITHANFHGILQMNADAAALLVGPDAKWKTLEELLDYIKQNPGKLKMSGTASGGWWDLARAGLLHAAGLPVDSIIWVPTKGSAPSLVELLGGHIDAVCCSLPEAATQIEAGQLVPLVVMSDERLPDFPDVPTAKEAGVDWTTVGWRGLAVPKDTPPELLALLEEKCIAIAHSDAYKEFMRKNSFGITIRGSDEFTQFLEEQDEMWQPVVVAAGYAKE